MMVEYYQPAEGTVYDAEVNGEESNFMAKLQSQYDELSIEGNNKYR